MKIFAISAFIFLLASPLLVLAQSQSKPISSVKNQNLVMLAENWNQFKLFKGDLEASEIFDLKFDPTVALDESIRSGQVDSQFITMHDAPVDQKSKLAIKKVRVEEGAETIGSHDIVNLMFLYDYNDSYHDASDYYDEHSLYDLIVVPLGNLLKQTNNYDVYVVERNNSSRKELLVHSKLNNEILVLTSDFMKEQGLEY